MYDLLKNAPPHDTDEFLDYLREHNEVVFEDNQWIAVENCKYHREDRTWITAFVKGVPSILDLNSYCLINMNIFPLIEHFGHLTWKKKSPDKQTVLRFHLHFFEE